jgi:hypothetical protein
LILGYSCQPTSYRDESEKVSLSFYCPSRGKDMTGMSSFVVLLSAFEFAMIIVWIASVEVVSVSF